MKEAINAGPFVLVLSSDTLGRGNEELGNVLMRSFLHTLAVSSRKPEVIIFYNTAVKLAISGSDVLEDLKQLENEGVRLLLCGTCVNYLEISHELGAGTVSNMYDIVNIMSGAGRLLTP